MQRKYNIQLWYIFVAVWGILLLHDALSTFRQVEQIPYSQFLSYLQQGKVEEVSMTATHIRGRLKEPHEGVPERFVTVRVEPELAERLAGTGVKFTGAIDSTWLRDLLAWVLPVLLFVGIWVFVIRRMAQRSGMGGGFMAIGKSKAKIYVEDATKVTFADVESPTASP